MDDANEIPRITLEYLLEEMMTHHVDNGFKHIAEEMKNNIELNEKLTQILMDSRECTEAVVALSAQTGMDPPKIAATMHVCIAYGFGVVIEMLHEREAGDLGNEKPTPGSTTIQ